MTTLRFLFILLVVLNALAFAAIKGWLGSAAPGGEPERISNQLRPEQIRLGAAGMEEAAQAAPASEPPPAPDEAPTAPGEAPAETASETGAPASAAVAGSEPAPPAVPEAAAPPAAAPVCVAWAELPADEADRLAARLNAAGFKYVRTRKETPSSWWVRTPPQGSRAQAEKRVGELRELGITDTFIVQESGPSQFAISLGLFRTEKSAQQLLVQLRAKGARDANAEPRMTTTFRIQASLPRDRVAAVEGRRPPLSERRTACTQ
ncbi:SPOR domain-containing protein [Thauera sinica]|uniref:SPOR domain-containing protein n=1 Tax=Thauera sinica TaxID=2665146 RepID=A0ABW1AU70_9RHOO|nr:SPOR domain-containing protein [Thauera sp. K11]ATE58569.1 sporulation protein [Thauera sp. K11]